MEKIMNKRKYKRKTKKTLVNLQLLNVRTRPGEVQKGLIRRLREIEKERGIKILKRFGRKPDG